MKWFNNLKIRRKLLLGFGIMLVLTFIMAAMSLIAQSRSVTEYTYLLEFPNRRLKILLATKENFTNIRRIAVTAVNMYKDKEGIKEYELQFNRLYEQIFIDIDDYIASNINDSVRDPEITADYNEKMEMLKSNLHSYKTQVFEPAFQLAIEDRFDEAVTVLRNGGPIITEANDIINDICDKATTFMNDTAEETESRAKFYINFLSVFSIIIYILSILSALLISSSLVKPMCRLVDAMNNMVKGKLNINRADITNDEIGQLTLATYNLTDIILTLIKEMRGMESAFANGDTDAKIDDSLFEGSYRTVSEGINSMVRNLLNETSELLDCLKNFGNGNFEADMRKLPGKKALINESVDILRNNLKSVAKDINSLIDDAVEGKLSSRVEAKKYKGGWAELLTHLNELLEIIIAPINEASTVLNLVSKGNFDLKVEGDYKGDFLMIKTVINETINNTAAYINEISSVLGAMANNDLNQEIRRDYVGKYSSIKMALNNIIDKLNQIISDISEAANHVASGSKQISESSQMLAIGATEQASSIEELNATIIEINESTMKSAENSKLAEELSNSSKINVQTGNNDMGNMLASMDNINKSSNNISKIIKVIDDIAFQTNLLALNAAVEAARAGEHGKGFAVVAEEVRSLAGRSQNSAKDTSSLIEESMRNVKEGSEIANATSQTLHAILDDVAKVSDIISEVSEAARNQADSISDITSGIAQITKVVQSNSATSEETAASSEILANQADILKGLVSAFKLKKQYK